MNTPTSPRIVAITGFMCAGKTTVAAALARRLACRLLDLDDFIARREGRTPRAIIEEDGEARFRDAETRALLQVLEGAAGVASVDEASTGEASTESSTEATTDDMPPIVSNKDGATLASRPLIIALGGGAWTLERNRALLARYRCLTLWLDAPFELCWQRIILQDGVRPLARERESTRLLYDERRAFYQLAALRVGVEQGRDAEQVASEIVNLLPSC